jgi:hypothetical protein
VVAEEAVISELVSARLSLTRENTGKFAIFGFEIAKAPRLSEENSDHNDASAIISWHIPQRGIPWQSWRRPAKAGIFRAVAASGTKPPKVG